MTSKEYLRKHLREHGGSAVRSGPFLRRQAISFGAAGSGQRDEPALEAGLSHWLRSILYLVDGDSTHRSVWATTHPALPGFSRGTQASPGDDQSEPGADPEAG